ncbi:MAG TPA: hypothetical protein IAB94_00220 [Candidatus Coproplasma avicola]|uniref:Uncharacterized protein n=1 Tax=Candidatus Coproplasma avicola TaxID=2840744 RepID=A0A9D1J896_9FIRM|nr:hypothetical protein [Candidatus Coproplasma avicola]
MNYCENCHAACEGDVCPLCGTKKLRKATAKDFCYLCQCDEGQCDGIADALEENGIHCVAMPYGRGVESQFGLPLSVYRLFVPFSHYERARDFLEQMQSARTEELRKGLLQNIGRLNIGLRLERRLSKKLKIPRDRVLDFCVDIIKSCKFISIEKNNGATGGFIFCYADECTLALDSSTYEVLAIDLTDK